MILRRDLWKVLAACPAGAMFLRAEDRLEPAAVQTGDVSGDEATVWMRCAGPGRMSVKWRTAGAWREARGPAVSAQTDFTGRVLLKGLPAGQRIFYEASVEGGRPLQGSFLTAPAGGADVRFLWSGDMVGQGWGINPGIGGITIFETMRKLEPHFFLHSGDTIYADVPVPSEIALPDGRVWKNLVTAEKSKVAETLDEFRGAYRYNLLDENVRRFSSQVAQIWQWDDHEVMNNWSPSKDIREDSRYREKDLPTLVKRARQAFLEYAPLAPAARNIYRKIAYGPLLDIFVLDMRSFRGPNTWNRQQNASAETAFLGGSQLEWLKRDLRASKALWKVMAADMPLGLVVTDGKDARGRTRFEASSNGDGPPLGRELEIASLLSDMKRHNVRNTVWLTADVHYAAAHHYHPERARFSRFLPFWEFVSGPLNAGTFGPGELDNTFGPRVMFQKAPPAGRSNLCPLEGMQFFGDVRIDGKQKTLTVTLRDMTGAALYSKTLVPEMG